ncbi:hypothetical protein GTY62_17965 [Streptomyces sp. SID724]|uniref:hypothetical protein n=1 Tax=Streptomyces sp. SID724 TaxID=2690324 RepID=UPI001361ABE3|nr:hypothetical protein [Streptomyces sp. SID724]
MAILWGEVRGDRHAMRHTATLTDAGKRVRPERCDGCDGFRRFRRIQGVVRSGHVVAATTVPAETAATVRITAAFAASAPQLLRSGLVAHDRVPPSASDVPGSPTRACRAESGRGGAGCHHCS